MKKTASRRRRRVVKEDGPDPIDVFVGKRVRERRQQENLSQSALGGHLGVSFQSVHRYEAGKVRISASTLFRLCRVLGVGSAYFFEGYVEAPPEAATKRERKPKR